MRFSLIGLLAAFVFAASSSAFFFFPLILPIPLRVNAPSAGAGANCNICPAPNSQAPNCPQNPDYQRRQTEIALCSGGTTAFFNANWSFNRCA
ncbi:hypothetical protein G6O67_001143 [Ophiocordyceps sinensis]|uniref:Uncharacterized protein n=2 Tax=Ophiocordyceps sinensis TaxID=72228 RepID=A0A8H4PWT4_9HYPO|nr:hypothetical protein OCS_05287 [Ophiocordyceps sinensis CO18]KAF4511947.1 hypothetical protein G6O67_001143 [Ophiocordyceps sinensis]